MLEVLGPPACSSLGCRSVLAGMADETNLDKLDSVYDQ